MPNRSGRAEDRFGRLKGSVSPASPVRRTRLSLEHRSWKSSPLSHEEVGSPCSSCKWADAKSVGTARAPHPPES